MSPQKIKRLIKKCSNEFGQKIPLSLNGFLNDQKLPLSSVLVIFRGQLLQTSCLVFAGSPLQNCHAP